MKVHCNASNLCRVKDPRSQNSLVMKQYFRNNRPDIAHQEGDETTKSCSLGDYIRREMKILVWLPSIKRYVQFKHLTLYESSATTPFSFYNRFVTLFGTKIGKGIRNPGRLCVI